jgi:hypothetical protein
LPFKKKIEGRSIIAKARLKHIKRKISRPEESPKFEVNEILHCMGLPEIRTESCPRVMTKSNLQIQLDMLNKRYTPNVHVIQRFEIWINLRFKLPLMCLTH